MTEGTETLPATARFLWDTDRARIAEANAAAVTLFGETALIDLLERPFAAESDLAQALADVAARAAGGEPVGGTIPCPGNGGEVMAHARAQPLPDGRIGLAVSVSGEAARPAPGLPRLAVIAATSALPACLYAADGRWLAGNRAADLLLGAPPGDLGKVLGDAAAAQRLTGAALADGLASAIFRIATRYGARLARVTLARARDPDTGAAAVGAQFTDIADRARALALPAMSGGGGGPKERGSAQATEPSSSGSSSPEARALLSRVGHELRTPLNAILGFAEIMADERFGPIGNPKYAEYARDILTGGEHLLGLVDDLLEIARSENGRRSLEFDSVDAGALVRQMADLLREEAGSRGIALAADAPESLPPVVADARSLRQILINLAGNALKFTEPGGQVTLRAAATGDGGLVLEVVDTGIGMNADDLAAALQPFGQVEEAQKGRKRGLGLGLPLAKTLAEANKAVFEVTTASGEGTRVTVTFPPTAVLAT